MKRKFRAIEPIKTGTEGQFNEYGKYKSVLQIDFHERCGYCNDPHFNMGGWRGMQIDHFAPKKPFIELEHEYSNLVYSCFYCNNAKRNDWVTNDSSKSTNASNTIGYIHPRIKDYGELYERNESGSIIPIKPVGFYIYTKLNLGLNRHSLIFTMDKIYHVVERVNKTLEKTSDLDINIVNQLKKNKAQLLSLKHELESQLRKILNAK